ncbi:MAG TPA: helix-turn-helix domain-containing protein [Longimicrobiaceae bacterium]
MRGYATRPLYVQKSLPLYPPLLAELRDRFHLRALDGWDDVLRAVPAAPASAVFVVDPFDGPGGAPAPGLRTLLAAHPSTTVVAVLDVGPDSGGAVRNLLGWGVADVVALGVEDTPGAVRERLLGAHARRLKGKAETALAPHLSAGGHALLLAAVEAAADGGGAGELARVLRASPRTVAAWCRRERLPNPRRLLAWARLLLAAALLDEGGRTVAQVARACGYTTDGALRRALRTFPGRGAAALRREGAFAAAALALAAELRAAGAR